MTNKKMTRPMVTGHNGAMPWAPLSALLVVALPLALLVVVTGTVSGTQQVEASLVEQTQNDLTAAGISTSKFEVSFDHRDGRITGELPIGTTTADVRAAVSSDGARVLDLTDLEDPNATEPTTAEPEVAAAPEPVETEPVETEPVETEPVETQPEVAATPDTEPTAAPTTVAPADDEPPAATPDPAGDSQVESLQRELDALEELIRTDVVFAASSDDLGADGQAALDNIVALLDQYPQPVLRIAGHTDDRGTPDSNAKLSASRAEAVTLYLLRQGVSPSRLEFVGAGASEPIADNSTAEGQAQNRRVQFTALEAFE